jgi:hypothetical protein
MYLLVQVMTALVDNLERQSAIFYKEVHNSAYTSASNTPQQDRDVTSPYYVSHSSVCTHSGATDMQKSGLIGTAGNPPLFEHDYVKILQSLCVSHKIVETYRNQREPNFSKRENRYDAPMAAPLESGVFFWLPANNKFQQKQMPECALFAVLQCPNVNVCLLYCRVLT